MPLDSSPNPEALLQHADFLRGLARGLVAGADADDVEQETWLRALEKGPRHDSNPRGWLSTVARNSARLWWRGESRRAKREGVVAKSEGVPSAAEVASRVEIQSLLAEAVKSLEEPYRTTVVLAFYDGLKPKQIAQQQGISVDTVRTRIRRALERLRARLDSCPGGRTAWVAALTPLLWSKSAAAAVTTGALVMSTRWKIALIVLILIPTVWLGREAWRGRAGRAPVRVERTGQSRDAGADADATGTGASGSEPVAPVEAPPSGSGFVVRIVAGGSPVAGAWVRVRGQGRDEVEVRATGEDGLVRTTHTRGVVVRAWHPAHGPGSLEVDEFESGQIHTLEVTGGIDVPVEVLHRKTGAGIGGAVIHLLSAGSVEGLHGPNSGTDDAFDGPTVQRVLTAITLEDLLARSRTDPIFRRAPVRTDETGRATLRGMPAGSFEAIVLHDDYLARRVRHAPVRTRPVRIRLDVGATLEVVAATVRGRPGRGLVCEVMRGGMLPLPVAFGRLDDEGRARFDHLPPGDFAVVVSSTGTGNMLVSVGAPPEPESEPEPVDPIKPISRVVTLREAESATVVFGERAGIRLHGRLLRRGEAVAGRSIELHRGSERVGETKTDEQGGYGFDELEPGKYAVRTGNDATLLVQQSIELEAGETEVELDLVAAAGAVAGTVVDANGKPLADCAVVVAVEFDEPQAALERGGPASVYATIRGSSKSDESGRYRVDGVPDGRFRVLFSYGGTLVGRRATVADGATAKVDVDLARERTHKLIVRFEDERGEPVPAALMVRGEHNGFAEAMALGVGIDEHVKFEYALPAGRYRLTATSGGRPAVHGERVDLKGDREVVLRFVRGVDFQLTVRRAGAPAAGSRVELIQPNGVHLGPARTLISLVAEPRSWRVPEDGVLSLPSLPPGRYELRIDGKRHGTLLAAPATRRKTISLE